MKRMILSLVALLATAGALRADDMAARAQRMVADRLLAGVTGADGRASLKGDRALWVDVVLQRGIESVAGMASLAGDLRQSDVEGPLRDAGFKVMDPKRRSLALGLRPTLALAVLYAPGGTAGKAFYLVVASVTQDCTPLGGETLPLITWALSSGPLPSDGSAKDVDAVRTAARAAVKAFIEAAKAS